MKAWFVVIFSLSIPLLAGCQLKTSTESVAVDAVSFDDEYEVYAALFEGDKALKSLSGVLIFNRTTGGKVGPASTFEDVIEQLSIQKSRIIDDQMVADYRQKNLSPTVLTDRFNIQVPHQVVDDEFLRSERGKDFPLLSLSRVAFNRDKTKAALYVSLYLGPKTSEGGFRTFEKRAGKWIMSERLELWVS
jgi:hypothetical protein